MSSFNISLSFPFLSLMLAHCSHFLCHHLISPSLSDRIPQRLIKKSTTGKQAWGFSASQSMPWCNLLWCFSACPPPPPPLFSFIYNMKQVGSFYRSRFHRQDLGGRTAGWGLALSTIRRHWLLVGVSFRPWRMRRMQKQGWLKRRKRPSRRRTRNWENYNTPWITISQRTR